jgi:hypothetical protein
MPAATERKPSPALGERLLNLAAATLSGTQRKIETAQRWVRFQRGVRYQYHLRPDDIFVASYPKSGTTLMQMMLHQLKTSGEMDFHHINDVSPWFEVEIAHETLQHLELPSPRVLKTHLGYGQVPRGARYIYLARDVRDVAWSAYHHSRLIMGAAPPLELFMEQFFAGRTKFRSWFGHIESWWPHRNDDDVLFLRYEEVTADLEGTARRVAAFCGLEVREEEMPRIVERCGIEFMRRHEEKFDPRPVLRGRRPGPSLSSVQFIREGKTGRGREVLSPAQKQLVASKLAALRQKVGVSTDDPYAALLHPRLGD